MTQPDGPAIERDLGAAISDVIAKHEHGMVLKWVALVETIGPDGDRGLWTMTSDGLKAWDTVGILGHGLDIQRAQTIAEVLHPDD